MASHGAARWDPPRRAGSLSFRHPPAVLDLWGDAVLKGNLLIEDGKENEHT